MTSLPDNMPAQDNSHLHLNATLQRFIADHPEGTNRSWLNFPKYVQIETASSCNARCVMCPVEDWKREHTIMQQDTFDKIANEIKDYVDWIERLTIQLDGEPLMDRSLESRIRTLKSAGIKFVAFATNGSLMTSRRAEGIIKSGVDEVTFSVDGATKETFEKIRLRLNFDKVVNNILGFVQLRDHMESDTRVRIRMTIQPANQDEFDDVMSFWRGKLGPNDSVYGKVLHTWGNSDRNYSLAEGYDFARLNESPCISPWTSLIILTDGRVPLCCCDYNASINLGNVRDSSIKELWQAQKFETIRRAHATQGRNAIPMCVNCTTWDDGAKLFGDDAAEALDPGPKSAPLMEQ